MTSRWIQQCQPKHKQNHLKLNQSNKLNENILIAKILEAFTPLAKYDPLKYTYQKYVQNQFLFLKSVHYDICKT